VASADDSTTTTASTTTTTLPPAPAGFTNTMVSVYQSELAAAQVLGQPQQFESVTQYQQQVNGFSDSELAAFYSVTQANPEWSQIPSLMQTIVSDTPTQATQSASVRRPTSRSAAPSATLMAMVTRQSPGPEASMGTATLVGATTAINPYNPSGCDTTDYDASIFAAQIVIDVSNAVYNGFAAFASEDNIAAAVVADVAAVVLTAVQIVHDVLVYLQTLENDCNSNNQSGYLANIDNTTVATYNLLTTVGVSVATIQTGVQNIQTQLTSFQTSLQQALTNETQTLQATTGSDNQGTVTELLIIQTALSNDVTTVQSLETTTGQQVVAGTSSVQTALSTDLTQILDETDADAQGLTTLVTQGNQHILNTLNAEAATAQGQYNQLLRLQIEQALAGFGPVVPEVKFMLPVGQGGFLNSTPVSVQSVVTADLASMQAIKAPIKPAAVIDLSAANTALTAGQYTTAFTAYAYAYQALA
jgi:hypothetical protein